MTDYKSINILIKASLTIGMKELNNYKKFDLKIYKIFINKLMYLLYKTCSNINFVVGQLSKYNADPRVNHICITKKIDIY